MQQEKGIVKSEFKESWIFMENILSIVKPVVFFMKNIVDVLIFIFIIYSKKHMIMKPC